MPPSPLCPTLRQLDFEDWFYRTTVSRISWIGHVSGCFAEANQLIIRNRLDALSKIFDRELCFGDHLRPRFAST
jgi:hypothetical protein